MLPVEHQLGCPSSLTGEPRISAAPVIIIIIIIITIYSFIKTVQ